VLSAVFVVPFEAKMSNMSQLLDVDPSKQWDWHEAHRDMSRNMYRTSYTDASHFKEVNVKSDFPSGYGGHIPSIRHDILHRNTAFDRQQALKRNDPSRDAHPSFKDHIAGIPTWCAKPQGAKKNPSYGVVPHDGTTTNLVSPWAVVRPVNKVPSYRNVPATLARHRSMPQMGGQSPMYATGGRVNQAALGVGAAVAIPTGAVSMGQVQDATPGPSPGGVSDRLKRSVSIANAQSNDQRMPSEAEMLMGEVFGQDQWE